ncbi:MAG: ATP-binding cassette domain-containing protein [Nitrospiraceae bacterium]|nr:ATP-binding cassette domain-containing protein [Nitrospiraceae bacterium]
MPPAVPAVEFRDVGFHHRSGRTVLSDISFALPAGEALALIGRSGSGKTTILKLTNCLFKPSTGEVMVEGKPTTQWDPIRLRRRIGYVLQDVGLLPHLTVARNIALVPTLEGWDPERIRHRVRELLNMVGLDYDRFGSRYPHELSGGQRQRVGVARAVAVDPPLLLMDEPFGALDPITRAELQQEFKGLQATLNKTVMLVTHDIPEACLLGTRIGLVQDGRLVECLPPDAFVRSHHPEVQAVIRTLWESNRHRQALS